MEFKQSLQKELGEHEPSQVDELILDDLFKNIEHFTTEHKKTLELYSNLEHLSLNGFGLKSLKNFPSLPNLKILELRDNHLNGSDLGDLKSLYPILYKLKLGDNEISTLDNLKVLGGFPQLKKLEVFGCKVSEKDTYRDELFKTLKNVQVIDKMDRNADEIDSTIYEDDEDLDDLDDGDLDDEDDGELDDEDEEGEFDDEDEEDEEEEEQRPKGKKQHRE
jgi:acidic leucine-rich nuclear phosphoprotein 32 family protein B